MKRYLCVALSVCLYPLVPAGLAQTAPPDPAPPEIWSVGPIDFSGLIDGYYSMNFNHPASMANQLHNFDFKANQFSLNMAKLSAEHTPDPIGFRVDFGFGRAFDWMSSTEPAGSPSILKNVEQAYVSFKPKRANGLQLDFGKFVTGMGAEVIETHLDYNYTRSLLFSWANPYYHFGFRASQPLGKHFTAGLHIVNGWNNVEDNNSGKTFGFSGAVNLGQVTWYNTYMVGPEKADTNKGKRQIYDTVVSASPTAKASLYVQFDYGVDGKIGGGNNRWTGIAGAARYQFNSWFALAPRVEWFNDADGFNTGTPQKLKEVTMTAEFKMKEGILSRLEYRQDWSNAYFFDRGTSPASSKNQPTLLLGFVAFFGPKR